MRFRILVFSGLVFVTTLLLPASSAFAAKTDAAHGARAIGDFAYVGMTDTHTLVIFDLATGDP